MLNYYKLYLRFSNLFPRDQDIVTLNQSLRVLSNMAAAGAFNSSGIVDEVLCVLLGMNSIIVKLKPFDGNDFMAKVNKFAFL